MLFIRLFGAFLFASSTLSWGLSYAIPKELIGPLGSVTCHAMGMCGGVSAAICTSWVMGNRFGPNVRPQPFSACAVSAAITFTLAYVHGALPVAEVPIRVVHLGNAHGEYEKTEVSLPTTDFQTGKLDP
ncbi:hypothetical protein TRVA0_021S01684 [Trichomonascus vanleenenianus]|uniref:uncharacterized protein n=1 Tax=Trichomonascus vanleenenianus TaxID=2268995 RepID=UPI003ECABAC1